MDSGLTVSTSGLDSTSTPSRIPLEESSTTTCQDEIITDAESLLITTDSMSIITSTASYSVAEESDTTLTITGPSSSATRVWTSTDSHTTTFPDSVTTGDIATSMPFTTAVIGPKYCSDGLENASHRQQIASLTHENASNSYEGFQSSFTAPIGMRVARLSFQFQSDYHGWSLDDVSIKADHDPDQEILLDGDFEGRDESVWNYCLSSNPTATPIFTVPPCRSGQHCFKSQSTDNESEYIRQQFNIESGATYSVEFYTFSSDSTDVLSVRIGFQ